VSAPLLCPWPSDLDLVVQIESLKRRGIRWSRASNPLKIRRSSLQIRPNRYAPIRIDHVATSDLKRIRFRISNQIPFQSYKIHIFWSVDPKIANNISLESLGIVLSSSTIISYILWVKFETNFRIESNLLLAC
jgi:hypothetical protein